MDTTTVLEIIKMIENKLDVIQEQEEIYKDAEDLFYELLTRRDLLEKIYAPF